MSRCTIGTVVLVAMTIFSGCGPGGGSDPYRGALPTQLPSEPPPAAIERPEELPPGWYIEPDHDRGLMLKNADIEETWVWIAIEWDVRGPDLEQALRQHRQNFEGDPSVEFLGSGEVEGSPFAAAVWSWGRSAIGEENPIDELVLFTVHPHRPAVLAFRYLTPTTEGDVSDRLEELLTISAVVQPVE